MSKGLRRKDLKGPDEFVSLTQHVLAYARQNERNVVLGAFGIVALIGIALGVRGYREWQSTEARVALGAAYQTYAKGDTEEAAEALLGVHENWPGTESAILGLAFAGNALAASGKKEEARGAFRQLLDSTSEPMLRQIALYNLGVLGEKKATTPDENLQSASGIDGPLKGPAWLALHSGDSGAPAELPDGISADARELFEGRRGS